MIAINTCLPQQKTHKVRCPECRGRICDMVVDEYDDCCHSYQILYNQSSKSSIVIKCQKCGLTIGISIYN